MEIRDGARVDASVELVSRCTIDSGEGTVRRLLVETGDGDRLAVVVAPSHGSPPLADRTGETYEVSGGLGCTRRPTRSDGERGPERDGGRGDALDADAEAIGTAVERLGVEPPFLVADGETTISVARTRPSAGLDGRPSREGREQWR